MFLKIDAMCGPTHWFVRLAWYMASIVQRRLLGEVPEDPVPRTLNRCSVIGQSPHSFPSVPGDMQSPGTGELSSVTISSFPLNHFTQSSASGSAFLCDRWSCASPPPLSLDVLFTTKDRPRSR